ncbi:F-box/kelch-repeat protein At3g06240-like [Bidens hawaiensis]|uniref:F-box/kelch-repeat protein At3g06240-like n=1 Tax=Bidens hawaiensis TaxID=980011 RepID=UPI00404A9D23
MKMKKIDELPLSFIECNILPRLPVKTLGRFMRVCKQWKSFLSTPIYARMRLHHVTINDYKLLVLYHRRAVIFSLLDWEPNKDASTSMWSNLNLYPSVVSILVSLDGLICLATNDVPAKLVFWNPFTGAYKRLSANPSNPFSFVHTYDAIGFYIDSSNDYKLLYLVNGGDLGAYVYSHILDSWREIEFSIRSDTACRFHSNAIFCGKCLYFMAVNKRTDCWIICFDVKTETFRKIEYPLVPSGAKDYGRSLVVLNGCIHLCVSYTISNLKQGDMWRMEGDGEWVNMAAFASAEHNELTRDYICSSSVDNWLAILEENNSFIKMGMEDFTTHCWDFCSSYTSDKMIYVESVVSPNP